MRRNAAAQQSFSKHPYPVTVKDRGLDVGPSEARDDPEHEKSPTAIERCVPRNCNTRRPDGLAHSHPLENTPMATTAGENTKAQGETVQQVEEELTVGKREAVTGGVRVTTSVSEKPVEQTVTLREEKVTAERQPADRALSPEEAEAAFEGKTVEMLGTNEEVAVSKQARVVGEVAIGKQVGEREETVKDTVRRTEVEVEEVGAKAR